MKKWTKKSWKHSPLRRKFCILNFFSFKNNSNIFLESFNPDSAASKIKKKTHLPWVLDKLKINSSESLKIFCKRLKFSFVFETKNNLVINNRGLENWLSIILTLALEFNKNAIFSVAEDIQALKKKKNVFYWCFFLFFCLFFFLFYFIDVFFYFIDVFFYFFYFFLFFIFFIFFDVLFIFFLFFYFTSLTECSRLNLFCWFLLVYFLESDNCTKCNSKLDRNLWQLKKKQHGKEIHLFFFCWKF